MPSSAERRWSASEDRPVMMATSIPFQLNSQAIFDIKGFDLRACMVAV